MLLMPRNALPHRLAGCPCAASHWCLCSLIYVPPSYQPLGRTGVRKASPVSSWKSRLPYQPIHSARSGVYAGATREPIEGCTFVSVTSPGGVSVRSVHAARGSASRASRGHAAREVACLMERAPLDHLKRQADARAEDAGRRVFVALVVAG